MNWENYDTKVNEAESIVKDAVATGRPLTEEEIAKVTALKKEAEGIKMTLDEHDKIIKMKDAGKTIDIYNQLPPVHTTQEPALDDFGFKSLGEYVAAIYTGDKTGRLENIEAVHTSDGGSDGYPLPPKFVNNLLSVEVDGAFFRDHATVVPPDPARPDAGMEMPALDQSAGPYGGVEVDWVDDEGGQKPETTAKFALISWKPSELAAWISVTDKLLRNESSANMILSNLLSSAYKNKEDNSFLFGDGVGKPKGVLNTTVNAAILKINREVAGKISYLDLLKMIASMTAEEFSVAVWIIDRKELPIIASATDAAGHYIYVRGEISNKIPDMLLGRPVLWKNKGVGVSLVNPKKYIIQDGTNMQLALSQHVEFTKNRTVLKIFGYVDGKTYVTAPFEQENGEKTSPFVVLDAPAGP